MSLLLGFVTALAGTAVAKAIHPTVFGACFEEGCDYAAMPVALLGTLVLAPLLWFALARAGPLSRLLLGILLFVLIGHFVLPLAVSLLGLVAFVHAIVRLIRRARAKGQTTRAMFITPRT
ncbi:hypothetical protein ACG3SL_08215 [Sphingomonas sp. CJ20]